MSKELKKYALFKFIVANGQQMQSNKVTAVFGG